MAANFIVLDVYLNTQLECYRYAEHSRPDEAKTVPVAFNTSRIESVCDHSVGGSVVWLVGGERIEIRNDLEQVIAALPVARCAEGEE